MAMSEDDLRRLARDAAAEQGIESAERMGRLAVALYQSLLAGSPARLAAILTRDWFYLTVHKSLWPNNAPSAPMWEGFEEG